MLSYKKPYENTFLFYTNGSLFITRCLFTGLHCPRHHNQKLFFEWNIDTSSHYTSFWCWNRSIPWKKVISNPDFNYAVYEYRCLHWEDFANLYKLDIGKWYKYQYIIMFKINKFGMILVARRLYHLHSMIKKIRYTFSYIYFKHITHVQKQSEIYHQMNCNKCLFMQPNYFVDKTVKEIKKLWSCECWNSLVHCYSHYCARILIS